MKLLSLLLAFACSAALRAQDPAAPAEPAPPQVDPAPVVVKPAEAPADLPPLPDPAPGEDPAELMRNQPGSRLKPAPRREAGLVPEGIPGNAKASPRPKGRTTLKPPVTSADLDGRIRYRQAHSRAANEPRIQSLWEESRVAMTDYDKRDALRRYYTTLYARMVSFDKRIAPLVEERRRVSLRRLDQTRVDPTDPMDEEHRQRRE